MSAVKAWSYSRWALYDLCPMKFKAKHIDKIPEPGSPAMDRGDRVHKETAAFLKGTAAAPPPDVTHPFQLRLLNDVRAFDDKIVEEQWGYNAEWDPVGWFDRMTWFRSVLDAGVLYEDMSAEALDWKTGKRYGSNDDQMETQAIAVFCRVKPIEHVTTRLVYFDVGDEEIAEFSRKDLNSLIEKWNGKVAPMFSDTLFPPRPNDKCHFCYISRSKLGICRFG